MPNPILNPDLYDVLRVAGREPPGITLVSGAGAPRSWDERKGYGLSGATLVFTGNGLAKFTTRHMLWLPEHFDAWPAYAALLKRPQSGTRPKALDIVHPWLDELDIRSAVVEDELQWDQLEPGLFVKDVKWIQYRAPKPFLSKPEGSTATLNEPKAEDEADKVIQDLVGQVKSLL